MSYPLQNIWSKLTRRIKAEATVLPPGAPADAVL
jgi:hypothetical protein